MATASNNTGGVPASCPSAAIFLRVIEQSLSAHCPGAARVDKAALHIGAVAFIHRFGSSLKAHVHFHVCVVDEVFEVVPGEADADAQATAPSVIFHPASGVDETTVAQVRADLRRRILRAFVGRGLIERVDAKEMLAYQHSGFSVDAGVCIQSQDRAGLERLLRYCARPPFAMDRLRQRGADLVYHCPKPQTGGKQADLVLTPLELIDRIAALVPPPRTHRHRYFGVLADAPDRVHYRGCADKADPGPHWCRLTSPRIAPARGPPLWQDCDAQMGEGVEIELDWDLAAQPAPDCEVDQRINW